MYCGLWANSDFRNIRLLTNNSSTPTNYFHQQRVCIKKESSAKAEVAGYKQSRIGFPSFCMEWSINIHRWKRCRTAFNRLIFIKCSTLHNSKYPLFHMRSLTTSCFIFISWHRKSLFSIKSNVLKLDTAQKVYSVNKGLFLGVFSSPWFACVGEYCNAIYHPLCQDILLFKVLATKTDTTVHLWYCSLLPRTHHW